MTKQDTLAILRLLSSLESWGLSQRDTRIPDYLHDELLRIAALLEAEILGEKK